MNDFNHSTDAQSAATSPAQEETKQSGSVQSNAKANAARKAGKLKGDLAYGQQQAVPTREGWTESDETVKHKLLSKELFPQG